MKIKNPFIILLLGVFFMPLHLYAQKDSIINKINSLNFEYYQSINKNPQNSLNFAKKAFSYYKKVESTELKFKIAANYTTALFVNEHYNEALSVLNKIEVINIKDNNKALYFTLRGLIQNDLNNYSLAEENYKKALELYLKLEDKDNEFTILNNLGLLYNNIGDYKRSLRYYLKCYEIINNLEIKVDRYKYYTNIGTVSYNLNDYNNALELFTSALNEAKINSDTIRIFRAHEKLAQTNVALNNIPIAITHYNKVLEVYKRLDLQKDVCNILLRMGDIFYSQDNKNIAFNYYNDCLKIAKLNSFPQEEYESSLKIGIYYQEKSNINKASDFYKKIIKNEANITNIEIVKKAYYALYTIEKQKNKKNTSLNYLEHYLNLNKKINEKQLISQKEQIQIQYNLKQKEFELENLQINYRLNELKLKNRKQQLRALILFSILIVFIFIFVLSIYLQKKKAQQQLSIQNEKLISKNKEIKIKRKELSELNLIKDQLLSIIAHDVKSPLTDLNNLLFIFRHNIEALNKNELKKNFTIIESNTSNLLNLLNNILNWTINQSSGIKVKKSEFSLTKLIKTNLNLIESSSMAKDVSVIFENSSSDINIQSDYNIVNFAVRNVLSNAIKFTNKKGLVSVKIIETKNNIIQIQISDNGIGFNEKIHTLLKNNSEKVPTTDGTEKEKGYGIGLSLCKKMLAKINSEIIYKKNKPIGSIFTICLKQ